ncbi:hypothetical protein BGX24_002560 [Mortierella sp. AD032]|nr:hypothetical protein BGX24_002560 [Mortierella sp. AD032]
MSTPFQRFRHGNIVESLAVRKDKITGKLYSCVKDIQETFSDAARFKVHGVVLNFLEDENDQRYEQKRIAHFPDEIIDIVVANTHVTLSPPASPPSKEKASSSVPNHHGQLLSTEDSVELSVSKLSLTPSSSNVLVPLPAFSIHSSNSSTAPTISTTQLMAAFSSTALTISDIPLQIERFKDQHSADHQQLLELLIRLVAQNNEMMAQQNEMLRQQAEAKERDERVLAELEAAKERDQERLRNNQQMIDRLIELQQRVEDGLVQNYELHEYPIPRLFVVLPDSFESWDPRNFVMERFRLFFLCECGEECEPRTNESAGSGMLTIAAAADTPTPQIRVKNRIHLAKHDGYELSRANEFFDQYGPYVLGMLRILRHCLAVAALVSPAVALADNSVKDVMDGVKSLSENMREAVDMSINILENKLGDNGASNDVSAAISAEQEGDSMFENLAALEGADLRRLDTFLRNNDKDKILGNLYRITTEHGHVKWVCFDHYRQLYRETAMTAFLQSLEKLEGTYHSQLCTATVQLKSSTAARDFFSRLSKQAPAVKNLDIILNWDFGSADLVNLVDMVAKSNVKSITLDLKDDHTSSATIAALRLGKGKYHSLFSLFSNTNLRRLQFSNLHLFGTRTSNLPSGLKVSWLQCFHFHGTVNNEGRSRLENILSHCPELIDLRLTSDMTLNYAQPDSNEMGWSLHTTICALRKLQRLRVTGWCRNWANKYANHSWKNVVPLQELVVVVSAMDPLFVQATVQKSLEVLEVLILYDSTIMDSTLDFVPKSFPASNQRLLARLTHLDLQIQMTHDSLELFSSFLPTLSLVHFGVRFDTISLLRYCDIASLKSLSVSGLSDFRSLADEVKALDGRCQIQSLRIHVLSQGTKNNDLSDLLSLLPLTRLHMGSVEVPFIGDLNLSELEILSLHGSSCSPWEYERILDKIESQVVTQPLVIELDIKAREYFGYKHSAYTLRHERLGITQRDIPFTEVEAHFLHFLQPILPDYSY